MSADPNYVRSDTLQRMIAAVGTDSAVIFPVEDTPRLVVLESPFAGDVAGNLEYGRRALADSLARGEAPIASHLLYTQPGVLDDTDPDQRAQGIAAGLAWGAMASAAVFYVDRGMSPGMVAAASHWIERGVPIETRTIGEAE